VFIEKNKQEELIETINSIRDIPEQQINTLHDLQPILDFWYYTKLLGYKDEYKPSESLVKQFVSEEKITSIDKPIDATYMYVYIRILIECDYNKFNYLEKHFSFLKSIAVDSMVYGYYLTHVILYDVKFGKVKASPATSIDALNELSSFCKNNLRFDRGEIDLMGEIILCCNLLNVTDFPYYSKMLSLINQINNYLDLHEQAVLKIVLYQQNK
tara:strand:- start:64 stop:702 length:639 start_codon:yes stop_codon:yes gene_type:complete